MASVAQYNKDRREKLIAAGLCWVCAKNPKSSDRTECTSCATRKNALKRIARARRRIAGVCQDCSSEIDLDCVFCAACLKKYRDRALVRRSATGGQVRIRGAAAARRLDALNAYGGAICVCCGETELVFLTLDHPDNNGGRHREITGNGTSFIRWLKRNNYPKGLQVLCWNCNEAKRILGTCPHQTQKQLAEVG